MWYMQGRHIMWGWLQERRKVGSYDYAGCLSLPRVMYISGNHLHQVAPAPISGFLPDCLAPFANLDRWLSNVAPFMHILMHEKQPG